MKKYKLFNGDAFQVDGLSFSVQFHEDTDAGYPWTDDCGCGLVRKSSNPHTESRSDKKPGERPLNSPDRNQYQFYYDWQEAVRIAKADGWNTEPFDAPNRALRAVQQNFDYCRAYLANDWRYVGVIVERLDADGNPTDTPGESDSLWNVETFNDYHVDTAYELAAGIASTVRSNWRESLRTARQVRKQHKVDNRFHDAMACGV